MTKDTDIAEFAGKISKARTRNGLDTLTSKIRKEQDNLSNQEFDELRMAVSIRRIQLENKNRSADEKIPETIFSQIESVQTADDLNKILDMKFLIQRSMIIDVKLSMDIARKIKVKTFQLGI